MQTRKSKNFCHRRPDRGHRGRQRGNAPLRLLLTLIFLLTGSCGAYFYQREPPPASLPASGRMQVSFLDVGQGNAVLFQCEGAAMLVDGGNRDAGETVVSDLKAAGVERLDIIVASHYDADHIGGLAEVLDQFPVTLVLDPDYEADTSTYEHFTELVAQKNGTTELHPQAGTVYACGEAEVTIVCPVGAGYEEENEKSLGIRVVHGSNSFLICGDAGTVSEREMAASGEELRATVYLASHHGSSGSSSDLFLDAVQPEYAVISCGLHNSYGHPHMETMERLSERGIAWFRTDQQGTITVTSNGSSLSWSCDPSADAGGGSERSAAS